MTRRKVYITPTTHWDREWVMTKGQFQVRWVNLVDRLLDILDEHPDYRFLLDGQTVVLEDYLAIRPERRDKLSALMEQDRLVAGPWYVLGDQFLANGESMIRNLTVGMEQTRRMRGRPMEVGYVPDSFGSIASLPLILNGFGIRYATFGRGRPQWDGDFKNYEFRWQGPAGSNVVAANHGYSHGIFLSYPDIWTNIESESSLRPDPAAVMAVFLEEAAKQEEKAASSVLHFSVGIDHMEARKSLPGIVTYMNEHQDRYELVYGTPEDYLKAVEDEVPSLVAYSGEMRGSEELPMDLVGTLSSYMRLKQHNDRCERMLQRELEPLWTIASMTGAAAYPKGQLDYLWKLLLANHPHDSICGCSLDQVHKDMMNRYEEIEGTGDYLIKDGLQALTAVIDTSAGEPGSAALIVVNPMGSTSPSPVKGLVRVPFRFKHDAYEIVDDQGRVIPSRIRHVTDKNKDLESVYMTPEMLSKVSSKTATAEHPADQTFTVLDVDFIARDVQSSGYRTYWIRPVNRGAVGSPTLVSAREDGMANEMIDVRFLDNGTFDLTHKKTGKTYSGLHVFADREEIGDLYDHHEFAVPDERRSSGSSKGWQLHEKSEERVVFKHEISWSLPDKAGDKVRSVYEKAVTIVTYATLHAGIDRLDLMTELDNVCEDHMLRVAFETGIRADAVHAYDHFNVVSRAVAKTGAEWRDNPFQEFVDVSDGETGLCLSSIGLPAYEAIQGANGIELQLTLVRSAGKIGPAAGANYPAPGGQSPGSHRFEYALIPHEGDWLQGNCASRAADYRNRMLLAADSLHGGTQPSSSAAITFVSGGDAATPVLSCLKRSEVGDDWIVRLWNPGKGSDIRLNSVSSGARFQRTRLDESAFAEESAESNINYRVTGGDLLTVRVSMKEPPRG